MEHGEIMDFKYALCVFRFPGKNLKGKKYVPLFQYFAKVCAVFGFAPPSFTFQCLSQNEDRPMFHFGNELQTDISVYVF